MRKPAILAAVFVALAAAGAIVLMVRPARTQQSTTTLTVGIYAPSVEFANAQARLQYVQGLAKAIESATGVKTSAQAFASLSALRKGGVDYAIVDGQCYATNQSWKLVANANIGGGTTRNWALYSSVGSDMKSLEGKKLAFVQTGCNDNGFIDNAMLESEVSSGFFAGRVGKPDITAAVAEVVSYKGAQAVFAPVGSQKGLTKVFDTGAVPNPAFVQLNTKVPSATASKVESAVTGFGGGGRPSGAARLLPPTDQPDQAENCQADQGGENPVDPIGGPDVCQTECGPEGAKRVAPGHKVGSRQTDRAASG